MINRLGFNNDGIEIIKERVKSENKKGIQGINIGTNLGDDVTYSGTIAAAMEGTLLGVSSIAISQDCEENNSTNFELAKKSIIFLSEKVLKKKLPQRVFLNMIWIPVI